jgi:thiamine-monophosphate kinase
MPSREQDLIQQLFAPLAAANAGALGLRDDAALVAPPHGHEFVVSADALVAGVHFLADDPADLIARKALRVNLSDLAAKGADPAHYLLTIALPKDLPSEWLTLFVSGLEQDQAQFGVHLAGGDTVSTPGPLCLSITVLGIVPQGKMVERRGARLGDTVYVTGTIGDGSLGLAVRRAEPCVEALTDDGRKFLLDRWLLPAPRVGAATAVRKHASAAMDISDGLVGDLGQLCDVSNVGAVICASDVPLSSAAAELVASDRQLWQRAVTGGDDYELLCTVPNDGAQNFEQDCALAKVSVTRIGHIVPADGGVVFADEAGLELTFEISSYSHI